MLGKAKLGQAFSVLSLARERRRCCGVARWYCCAPYSFSAWPTQARRRVRTSARERSVFFEALTSLERLDIEKKTLLLLGWDGCNIVGEE